MVASECVINEYLYIAIEYFVFVGHEKHIYVVSIK